MKPSKRYTYIIVGSICLVLAYIGVVLPGIPGTPFIILTAYFYLKSSDKLYKWLLSKKLFAKIIHQFNRQEKLSWKTKLLFLVPVWISALVADILFAESLRGHIIIAVLITGYTLIIILLKKIEV